MRRYLHEEGKIECKKEWKNEGKEREGKRRKRKVMKEKNKNRTKTNNQLSNENRRNYSEAIMK